MIKKLEFYFNNQLVMMAVLLVLIMPVLLPLTQPGFFPTQDFIHVARIAQMDKAIKDLQFPVRWVPDFRYGEPLFNFYAPLPYYIGALVHNFNFSFLSTTKILFGMSFVFSALAMFFLAKAMFGKLGAVLAAILYTYAPYHSVDVYVRGAMSESLALIFFPLIYLAVWKLNQKTNVGNFIFLSLSLTGLFLTHNIMTILFLPFFIGWMAFLILTDKNYQVVKYFLLSTILAVGSSATFLLPAFFEKSFVQSDKLISGYFDFRGHFVEIKQFFSPFWGYGASLWGGRDDMSFQIGILHWLVLGLSLLTLRIFRKNKKMFFLLLFVLLEFLFSLFMQHNKSTPIWISFPILAYTQFSWRFLGISIFLISLMAGALGLYLKKRLVVVGLVIILTTILANIGYFKPESYYYDSVDDHYVSAGVLAKDDKLPKDYLPIWVEQIMDEKIINPHALHGRVDISDFKKRSSQASFRAHVLGEADIEVPITYFPGWQVTADNQPVAIENPLPNGLIRFNLPKGEYLMQLNFGNTPIRLLANLISVVSLIILLTLPFVKKIGFKMKLI